MNRRTFLKQAGILASTGPLASGAPRQVALTAGDPLGAVPAVQWAAQELEMALGKMTTPAAIIASSAASPAARQILTRSRVQLPAGKESFAIVPVTGRGKPAVLAAANDARGLVYALLELADRVRLGAAEPFPRTPLIEQPANKIRSVTRCFVSDVEDKPWYNDRSMWPQYLAMLASQRFNRFSLAFGIGYDFLRQIRDCYFHFPYPFLVTVPGYDVRAVPLGETERAENLEMLKFIGKQTAAHGLDFQLAIWTHGYKWADSPKANYLIEGLEPENHAAYCRDALHKLLMEVPEISGVTFRIHGESGVAEGSNDFWKTLFDGIARTGRKIEIDMHAKGLDFSMIDLALSTGMPVKASPKFWAEHMGLPYHQAAIRELEMPKPSRKNDGFFALSSGSRSFLRYSYGDLLAENRSHGVLFRIWPGTQRLLLWGDPAMAAAYGRTFQFCGADGVEICEPLSFKGRKGSGIPMGRNAYVDASLRPRYDWEKYLYTYRLWGRLLYNPAATPDTWRRAMPDSGSEAALANASRILPLVTTAHGPSAANNNYWPEMYFNMSIVDAAVGHPYGDTRTPKHFRAVTPFDPQLFSRIDEFAEELLKGERSGKYSPCDVAQWLDQFADAAAKHLAEAGTRADKRLAVDVKIQSGLGKFFAAKLRSGVYYELFEKTSSATALEKALAEYRAARDAWAALANTAKGEYVDDVTFGYDRHLRGHWIDRLPLIDADIERMSAPATPPVNKPIPEIPARLVLRATHTPPTQFRPAEAVPLHLSADAARARLHYRHVNQGELWRALEMERSADAFHAAIDPEYTGSRFALQYYFELWDHKGQPALHPGIDVNTWAQPYFVIRQRA